jgi:predicted aldo/keto reductase-like oxidoreductase
VIDSARVRELSDDKKPSACLGCGACEAVCPQNIKISEMMTDFASRIKK